MNTINNLGYKLDKTYNDIQGAYGYNGVISSSSKSDFIDSFYNAFNEWCKVNSIIAEFTRLNPYLENHNFSKEHLHIILNRKTVVLNLNDTLENLWEKAFSSKTRNMIRKGLKKNYIVTTDNTEKGVMDFYRIYLETMMGIEANPYYYFNKDMFMEMLKSPSFHFLFVDDKDNNRVATIILMVFGKYAHYHLSGRDIEKADNSVNNYLLYEAIKIAKNKGAKIFHLGEVMH